MRLIFSIVIINILLFSCECVNDLDTEKRIIPTEFASNRFYNFNSVLDEVDIYSDDIKIDFSDKNYQFVNYIEYSSGAKSISLKIGSEIIYNSLTNFQENGFYTSIFFGNESRPKLIYLQDDISPKSSKSFYIRIVNISNNELLISKNNENIELTKYGVTDFIEMNAETVLILDEIKIDMSSFINGEEYTYILGNSFKYIIDA